VRAHAGDEIVGVRRKLRKLRKRLDASDLSRADVRRLTHKVARHAERLGSLIDSTDPSRPQ